VRWLHTSVLALLLVGFIVHYEEFTRKLARRDLILTPDVDRTPAWSNGSARPPERSGAIESRSSFNVRPAGDRDDYILNGAACVAFECEPELFLNRGEDRR
jgi:hypothetical protein